MDKRRLGIKNKTDRSVSGSNNPDEILWHTKSIEDAVKELDTDIKRGISEKESAERIEKYGYNELEEKKG